MADDAAGAPGDHLFDLPPDEFVAARDALAKELRNAGRRGEAREVRGLRRPTVAAWALNQLARRHGGEVEALVDAGDALRRAQRRALSGLGGADLREAGERRREIVTGLVDRAEAIMAELGAAPGTHRDRVAATLEAASADPDAAEALRAGRLSTPLPPPTGFGDAEGFAVVDGDAGPGEAAAGGDLTAEGEAAASGQPAGERDAAADRAVERAQRAVDEAEQEARAARRAAADAERDAREQLEEAEQREREAAAARRRADAAENRARSAARAADKADARVERRRARLRRAEEHRAGA